MRPQILKLFAALTALLLPGLAAADVTTGQAFTVKFTSGVSTLGFSKNDCLNGRTGQVTVDYASPVPAGDTVQVFLTDQASCPNDPATADLSLLSATTLSESQRTFTVNIPAQKLGKDGCPDDKTFTWLVCGVVKQPTSVTGTSTSTVVSTASVTVTYDSQPPGAPTITGISGGESSLFLSWEGEDVAQWVVSYRPVGTLVEAGASDPCSPTGSTSSDGGTASDEEFQTFTVSDGTARSTTLSGLVNEQTYEVKMVGIDSAGNQSPESNTVTGSPREVLDFYRQYRCAGGDEKGGFGCSTSGSGGALALGVVLAALASGAFLRRRRA